MMSKFLAFVWDWRFVLVVIAALIVWAILDWNSFKTKAYQLMLLAKSKAKDLVLNSGQEQEDWVVANLMPLIPIKFKPFLTEERVKKIVYWLYHKAKDKLDNGKFDNSI
jgi:hypothetical protein